MTGTQQGQDMDRIFTNPWFLIGVLLAALFSLVLAYWRRQNRKHKWYTPQLPAIVSIGVGSVLLAMGPTTGWANTFALFLAFAPAGVIQWLEVITWEGEEEKRKAKESAHDPEKEVARRG